MKRSSSLCVSVLLGFSLFSPVGAQGQLGLPLPGNISQSGAGVALPAGGNASLKLPVADVKTTPMAWDDLTDEEKNAIKSEFLQTVTTSAKSPRIIFDASQKSLGYIFNAKSKRNHAEWVRFFQGRYNADSTKFVDWSSGSVPISGNAISSPLAGLGITYTVEDLFAAHRKFQAKDVEIRYQDVLTLFIADAILSEMRKSLASIPQSGGGGATRTASLSPLSVGAIEGTYRHEPFANNWHQGTLEPTGDFRLKWTNQAGTSWGLTVDLQSGVLRKDEGSPYQNENGKEFVIARDAMGNVVGFQFKGEFYKKM